MAELEHSSLEAKVLQDTISENTRRIRRNLLATSAGSIFIAETGLMPTRIFSLGIELQDADQRLILLSLAFVISYMAFSFSLYAFADFLSYIYNRKDLRIKNTKEAMNNEGEEPLGGDPYEAAVADPSESLVRHFVKPISIIKIILDIIFPGIVSLYAIIILIC